MVVGKRNRVLHGAGPLCRSRHAAEERESLNPIGHDGIAKAVAERIAADRRDRREK